MIYDHLYKEYYICTDSFPLKIFAGLSGTLTLKLSIFTLSSLMVKTVDFNCVRVSSSVHFLHSLPLTKRVASEVLEFDCAWAVKKLRHKNRLNTKILLSRLGLRFEFKYSEKNHAIYSNSLVIIGVYLWSSYLDILPDAKISIKTTKCSAIHFFYNEWFGEYAQCH